MGGDMSKPTKPQDPTQLRPHLEAIARLSGVSLPPGVGTVGKISLFQWLGAYMITEGPNTAPPYGQAVDSEVTSVDLILGPHRSATEAPLTDVSGVGATGSDGTASLYVGVVVPSDGGLQALEPVHIVATAQGNQPVFLTFDYRILTGNEPPPIYGYLPVLGDIHLTVYAWKPDGKPAADVQFHWRCRCNTAL
jgi:hypothetical protein